jgi:hypothetical protein
MDILHHAIEACSGKSASVFRYLDLENRVLLCEANDQSRRQRFAEHSSTWAALRQLTPERRNNVLYLRIPEPLRISELVMLLRSCFGEGHGDECRIDRYHQYLRRLCPTEGDLCSRRYKTELPRADSSLFPLLASYAVRNFVSSVKTFDDQEVFRRTRRNLTGSYAVLLYFEDVRQGRASSRQKHAIQFAERRFSDQDAGPPHLA